MSKQPNYEDFSKQALSNIQEGNEAISKAQKLAMKGFENYFKSLSDIAQKSTDSLTSALKKLIECNSLNELAEAQQIAVQQILDDAIVNTSKLSELTVKLYSDTFEPINSHFTKTYKKVSDTIAA